MPSPLGQVLMVEMLWMEVMMARILMMIMMIIVKNNEDEDDDVGKH